MYLTGISEPSPKHVCMGIFLGPERLSIKNYYHCLGSIVASSPSLFFSLNVMKETKRNGWTEIPSFHCIMYTKNFGMRMRLEA